jgi:hypothetical protein
MLATIITVHDNHVQVGQFEAPTVKDCLIAWAGRISVEGQTDEGRTRLRGIMADFDQPPLQGFGNVWKLQSDLGLTGASAATVIVVESVRP